MSAKWRVVAVDSFDGPFAEYLIGEFDTEAEAITAGEARLSVVSRVYVYAPDGAYMGDLAAGAGT